MPLDVTQYTTRRLLGIYYDDDLTSPAPAYWLQFFTGQINFDTEWVEFGQIGGQRKIAPLVVPTVQGKPMYSAAERRTQVKPAYVKPKDAVSASRVLKKHAGFGEIISGTNMTPAQRYNLLVADILDTHRKGIELRWEWMASHAIQNGSVILEDEAYPRTVVDFQRDPLLTVTLTGAARWGQTGVNPLADIAGWRQRMRNAKFGAAGTRITMGARAWELFSASPDVRATIKTDFQPGTYNNAFNLGGREGEAPSEWMGRINGTVDIYVYADTYEAPDGTLVNFMDTRDVVITSPRVQGVRCFGAIVDVDAQFQALSVFPKMWNQQDPSATFLMTQSAPLMVPTNPNATFRARVTDV